MTYYMLYDYESKAFISNMWCDTIRTAYEKCVALERVRGYEEGTICPIKFVDGMQKGII